MARRKVAGSVYQPQLATLVDEPPQGDRWIHELKYDGYRIGAIIDGSGVRLVSRNGNDWTADFSDVVKAVEALRLKDAVLDGGVCAVLPDGRTSFSAMQHYRAGTATIVYYVFDAPRWAGKDISGRPLIERKDRLAAKLPAAGTVQYAGYVEAEGAEVFAHACKTELEGIISKVRDAPYLPGRSKTWLKTKCVKRQEFVIGGFTDPEGSRQGIGALLLGYYDDAKKLAFAGKVGTGWNNAQAAELRQTLEPLLREENPFDVNGPDRPLQRRAHWVTPRLVGEVMFTEWTHDNTLRHPSFQGLRRDKKAREVRHEQ
jgi:bifunctional non-homologous end joining protein LigD